MKTRRLPIDIKTIFGTKIVPDDIRPPEPSTRYLLMAYYTAGRYWSYKGEFINEQGAIEKANRMSPCWNFFRIIKVDLP